MKHTTTTVHRHIGWLLITTALLTSGCLSEAYTVSDREIERLAQTPPEERARRVRVAQRLSWQDAPSAAPHRHEQGCDHYHHVDLHIPHTVDPPARVRVGARPNKKVIIHRGPSGRGANPRGAGRPRPSAGRGPRAGRGGRGRGARGSRGGSRGGGGGGSSGGAIKDGKALAAAIVIGAAVVTVGLVATEGKRYDGWVEVDPDHPVHLVYDDGSTQMMSLSELTPEDARDARHMILVDEYAYDMDFLGRAPLSRQGWTWKFEGGFMALAPPNDLATELHPGAWMELGYFPHQSVGLVGFLGLAGGMEGSADVLGVRTGLGLEIMPLRLGRLHLGAYGIAGMSFDGIEGPDQALTFREDPIVGGGGLLEIDLTTRLALTARAGVHVVGPRTDSPVNTVMTTFGLAVY